MILLVIVLPLDVWDILVAEQPSSEEWHIKKQDGRQIGGHFVFTI
jgi:hypothetical protein